MKLNKNREKLRLIRIDLRFTLTDKLIIIIVCYQINPVSFFHFILIVCLFILRIIF